jgi:hypothetical protein
MGRNLIPSAMLVPFMYEFDNLVPGKVQVNALNIQGRSGRFLWDNDKYLPILSAYPYLAIIDSFV